MINSELEGLIKKFSVFEWLVFINVVESMSKEHMIKITYSESEWFHLRNSNWHPILIDLAIRLSNYDKTDIIEIYGQKMSLFYQQFISLYVNHHDDLKKYEDDLENNMNLILSRSMYEQLRHTSPYINSLGRLIKLYEDKENLFKQEFGLTNKQMILFYYISVKLSVKNKSNNSAILLERMQELDSNIKKEHFELFLNNFSISIREYRIKVKELGITKHTITCERLIYKYPIVKYNDSYVISSINVLLDVLTYKIFDKLYENSSESFKRKFGNEFENYIRDMTRYFHKDNMVECSNLMKSSADNTNRHAEFYIREKNNFLVVEAKVLAIDEEMIINKDIKELEKKFKNTIKGAVKQMNSCSKKLSNMYGLIVIHTHIPAINTFFEKYKSSLEPALEDKVILISIVEYENLISRSFVEIINQINLINKNPFNLIESRENKYLEGKYVEYINPIIETIESNKE